MKIQKISETELRVTEEKTYDKEELEHRKEIIERQKLRVVEELESLNNGLSDIQQMLNSFK
jgi:hypothetical protein